MHRDLAKAAKSKGCSISEEIEFRLTEWAVSKELRFEAKAELDANRIQAMRQAGFQIVREAGGNVTVNVSPELLRAEADGILRSGFVAVENVDKSPLEILVKRTVEEAIESALTKAGLLGRKGVA
jgi:hypothetical protein